ncbi:hypothetical protein [Gynuella sunshinyii]|uniref:Methionine synthase I, cobalamin-binding domain n=1 Tax=Gynuella sunshinyii YC6258 TaxID=1445510 RepID=A0A0C5VHC4_9GAMM|nr:hypothetical protein [Gynuella sunshinyii]AJQ93651.1 methionine synthase I, cobalamin-binding domain [Gynuella sunshinyii YC6258]
MKPQRLPCRVVLGDLDYVADSGLIRRNFSEPWSVWETLTHEAFSTAVSDGYRYISLYARGKGMTETEVLLRLMTIANEYPDISVLLHHFDHQAVVPALQTGRGRVLLSYVSGESWMRSDIAALLTQYQPQLVVQPINDAGIPATAEERLEIVEDLYQMFEPAGLLRENVFVDALSPSLGVLPFPLQVSVDTVTLATAHGFSSIAWPANAGLGHGDQAETVAAVFASALVQAGLSMAVVSSKQTLLLNSIDISNRIIGSSADEI